MATVFTQPLWSLLEGFEKILGVAVHPERLDDPAQVQQSIANTYGNLFRLVLVVIYFLARKKIRKFMQDPLANGLRSAGRALRGR